MGREFTQKNVGLLSALFILLNIIIIVLFVNHGRGKVPLRSTDDAVRTFFNRGSKLFSRHLRVYIKRVFLPVLYNNNMYTLYNIAIYRYDINDLTPADFSAELLLGFVDIVRQTVVHFGSRIRYV